MELFKKNQTSIQRNLNTRFLSDEALSGSSAANMAEEIIMQTNITLLK